MAISESDVIYFNDYPPGKILARINIVYARKCSKNVKNDGQLISKSYFVFVVILFFLNVLLDRIEFFSCIDYNNFMLLRLS